MPYNLGKDTSPTLGGSCACVILACARRTLFVAMTRAMEQLYLTHAGERRRFGDRSFQSPSRFLAEVPEELVEVLRSQRTRGPAPGALSGGRRTRARADEGSSFDYSYSQESGDGEVSAGTRVRHPVFGPGEVMSVSGAGANMKLKIRFQQVGVKTVMLRFANLELI